MTNETTVDCVEFRDLITDFLEKALSPAMTLAMEQHRHACANCEEFLGQIRLTIEALGSLNRQKPVEPIPSGLLSALREWRESAAEGGVRPEKTIHALLKLPDYNLKSSVEDIPVSSSNSLGQMAIDEAVRMGVVEPRNALKLARVGVELFRRGSGEEGADLKEANDGLAQAWAVLGNARRICSDFRGAGEAFRESERYLASGTGGRVLRADFLRLKSAYLAECGELSEAIRSIDEAVWTYQSVGDSHLVGRALIGKGTLIGPFGESSVAVETLRAGLELIDISREPRLALVAKHNLVHSLIESGSRDEALKILTEARKSHIYLDNPVDLIRLQWLEGKIALDLGDMSTAEELFLQVKSYFVEHEMAHDAAVVSLDLAMVYLKQGRTTELKELAGEMVTIFSGLGIRREIFAAMAFFNKAQEIEQTATMGLLQELIEVLEGSPTGGSTTPPEHVQSGLS